MNDFSVVTIVKGRRQQLRNQMTGILRSRVLPRAYIVVLMDDDPLDLPFTDKFEVIIKRQSTEESVLPLAEARNLGYRESPMSDIIFLDVDCIPSPTLFSNLIAAVDDKTIVCAYPRYLSVIPADSEWSYLRLMESSIVHPKRDLIPPGEAVDHNLFWSLVFIIKKQTIDLIGGFDQSYTGYGAEDTDFANSASSKGINVVFVRDTVLHQYHDKYDPPLNYFNDIIHNARTYYDKWHVWPMESWLKKFEEIGLIEFKGDAVNILRSPTSDEIKAAHSTLPY